MARSLRAHFLAQSALYSIILDTLIAENKIDLSQFKLVYEKAGISSSLHRKFQQ